MRLDDFSVSHDGIKTAIEVERLGAYIHLSYFSYFAMSTKNMYLLGKTYDTSISLGF